MPPHARPAHAGCAGRARPARAVAVIAVGRGVAERRLAVLDVVVERAGRRSAISPIAQRHEGDPVVVEMRELAPAGNGSAKSSRSRRISDAAPVTALATSSEARSEWLLRAGAPVGVGDQARPSAVDDASVAVDELRSRRARVEQRLRACRGARRRPGRPARRTRTRPGPSTAPARSCGRSRGAASERETTKRASSRERPAGSAAKRVRAGAVVADDTDPVAVRLGADRLDLAPNRSIGGS